NDIMESPTYSPSRWTIDFGLRTLEECLVYPAALEILRTNVKPERANNPRKAYRDRWWLFAEPRTAMRKKLTDNTVYAAAARHSKRFAIVWVDSTTLASDATNAFAFDDDYSMGILLSRAHDAWAWARSSTLETRLRYTPTTVFETFPWPDPVTPAQREVVAAASVALYERRSALCLEHNIGLTALYNLMDDGGFADLAALHRVLDEAVAAAYGWPKSVAQNPEELVKRLTDLNRQITEGTRTYSPFTAE
ncbi:MAG: type IIL restriction-modification enzyme MmeI, partial [Terrimesophilobacter sp.]